MNIRKIIREEIDSDWAFMGDINPYENMEEIKILMDRETIEILERYISKTKSFKDHLYDKYDQEFFVIILKDGMGTIDLTIDGGIDMEYYNTFRDWYNMYGEEFNFNTMDDGNTYLDSKTLEILNKLLPIDQIRVDQF